MKIGSFIALRLWVAMRGLTMCLVVSGCLLPPPIEEGAPLENHPPRILPETISPLITDGPVKLGILCESEQLFLAYAEDPDPNDTLYWRVFVNYHSDPAPWRAEVRMSPPDSFEPFRARELKELLIPASDSRFGLGDDRLTRPHTLELFVADRPLYDDSRAPQGRAIDSGGSLPGLSDSVVWTIQLLNQDCK